MQTGGWRTYTLLSAPTKKRGKGKRHSVVCNIAALNKPSKINQAFANPVKLIKHLPGQDQPTALNQRGVIICVFWTHEIMDCHAEDTKNEGGKYYHAHRSSTCMTVGSRTSNMVWFTTLLLRALLLDELWTNACLAETVKPCIKTSWLQISRHLTGCQNTSHSTAQSEPRTCSIETACLLVLTLYIGFVTNSTLQPRCNDNTTPVSHRL